MNIYIVRHGETDYNVQGRVQGRAINSHINAKGQAQAEAFADAYADIPFDAIYVSALQRTAESIEPIRARLGLPTTSLADLDEIHWGPIEGGEMKGHMRDLYDHVTGQWNAGNYDARFHPEGESAADVQQRMVRAYDAIAAQPHANVLVCTHGRAMRMLLAHVARVSLSEMDLFAHSNMCVYHLDAGHAPPRFIRRNCVLHLEGFEATKAH